MAKKILKGLKWTFFLNFIVFVIVGAILFFLVEDFTDWFGKALLGFASASFIAWQQTEWEKVKILVIMQIVWHMLGVYTFFWWEIFYWQNIFILLPVKIMNLIYLFVFSGFLAAFIVFYIKQEKEHTTLRDESETVPSVQENTN
ncbi:MAG: hypothetical protein JSV62_02405 [Promethearchaeota archaeon]|nr:MAG: hypothetical protein JSV62_02405 [Candidatus Lokiarchaeota archaeon]